MRPDLNSPEGRAAYRRELRRVAIFWRGLGFALILAGVLGMIRYGRAPQALIGTNAGIVALIAVASGWALLIVAVVKRGRYHKARMAKED